VALLVLNISTIGTIVYHNIRFRAYFNEHSTSHQIHRAPDFLRHRSFIGDEHSGAQKEIIKAYKSEARLIFEEMQIKREAILNNLSGENADTIQLKKLAHEMGQLHEKLKLLTINFYLKAKAVSTPEEQEELFQYFNYLIRRGDGKSKKMHKKSMHN